MKHTLTQKFVRKLILVAFLVAGFTSFFFSANANIPFEPIRTQHPLPEQTQNIDDTTASNQSNETWEELVVKIRKNGSLSTALDRLKISPSTTHAIGLLKNSHYLTNLRSGDELRVWVDKHHQVQKILYPKSQILSYELIKTEEGYRLHEKKEFFEKKEKPPSLKR